jgi:hypothetical protein
MLRKTFCIWVLVFIGTFFLSALVAKAQIVTNGLVSYWSFDKKDIEGKTVKDVFGKNNGTMVGNPKVVNGKMGDALEFAGAADYVEVPDDKSLQLWKTYTLEAWIFQMESRSSRIIDKITAGTADGPHLDTHPGTILRSCAGACISSNTQYKLETWNHVVQTFDEGDVQFYLNGNPDGDGKAPSPLSGNKLTLKIGADSNGRNLFKGIIDEVKIYNRAITGADVKQNFTSKIGLAVHPTGKLATRWGEIKVSR